MPSKKSMMQPCVSMGMPVFNGEFYLEAAIDSLLSQTFGDFELIISDNASDDRTGEICQDYAALDDRIRYIRNENNIGFASNQNNVISLSSGKYFLLTHCDDIRAPDYLEKTRAVLEADPSVVICYSATQDIDENGDVLDRVDPELRWDSRDVRQRFREVIRMDHICEPDFGLTRLAVLNLTKLHGKYADSDRVLLADLALRGRFHKIPEVLFFRRDHPQQSTAVAPGRYSRTVWFNPALRGKVFLPHFRQLQGYLGAIHRSPVSKQDKVWCNYQMLRWMVTNRKRLQRDLINAAMITLRKFRGRME